MSDGGDGRPAPLERGQNVAVVIQENGVAFLAATPVLEPQRGVLRVEPAQRLRKFQYEARNGDVRISRNGAAISTPVKTAAQSTAKIVLLRQDMVPSPMG